MKKFWIQIGMLITIILGSFYLFQNPTLYEQFLPSSQALKQQQLKINNTLVNIEVADSATQRSRGLSNRENLATNSGMLFVYPEVKEYRFWMKDMKFALDMIFINHAQVVDIIKNVPPPLPGQKEQDLSIYQPQIPVNMVLEVNAGFTDQNQIKVGDEIFLIKN